MDNLQQGWSFIIITSGPFNEHLNGCVSSIVKASIDKNYEIIVVGGVGEFDQRYMHIKFEEEKPFYRVSNVIKQIKKGKIFKIFKKTGAIAEKKNIGSKFAKFDKLCILHDYVSLRNDWFHVYQSETSNDWDILVPKVLNSNNKRHRDWVLWNDPIYSESKFPNCLPPYEYDSNFYYINGTVMVVKNIFLSQNPLNNLLFWGQGEDVEWSLRVRQKAKLIKQFDLVFKYLKLKNDDPSMDEKWNKNLNILLKKNK